MYYTRLKVVTLADFSEILMAEVAEADFDTFMEKENGFEAYGEENKINLELLEAIKIKYAHVNPLLFFIDKVKKENWNKEWEKNVEPIVVEEKCLIRASFHNIQKKYPYEIVITPKMSFGTGHHQTTYLMLKNQLMMDHHDKYVMDVGCGTAILSVMASKRGAREIEAFDMDEWSVPNGKENAEINHCKNINIRQGTIRDFFWPDPFDIVLANINKNVLLDEIEIYSECLKPDGLLLMSGFYQLDIADLVHTASRYGFKQERQYERETWASLLMKKTL